MAGDTTTQPTSTVPTTTIYNPWDTSASSSTAAVESTSDDFSSSSYMGDSSLDDFDSGLSNDPLFTSTDEFFLTDSDSMLENVPTIVTDAKADHIVTKSEKTTIYNLSAAPDGQFIMKGIPNNGFVRVKRGSDDYSVILEVMVGDKVVDTAKVSYTGAGDPPPIFLQGGTKVELDDMVRNSPFGKSIYHNKTPDDLSKDQTDKVHDGKVYQLTNFRYINDKNTLTFDGEDAVVDIVGDGSDKTTYEITEAEKVDETHYNFTIKVRNAEGGEDTVVLENADTSTTINLFSGTLTNPGAIPSEIQKMFPKNFKVKSDNDLRQEAIQKKLDGVNEAMKSLPALPNTTPEQSQALYQEMLDIFTSSITSEKDVSQTMSNFIDRINGRDKKAAIPLIYNMTQILSQTYPELLKHGGDTNINGILASALISDSPTAEDIGTYAILQFFSGEDNDSIRSDLDELKNNISVSDATWQQITGKGLGILGTYLLTPEYMNYAKDPHATLAIDDLNTNINTPNLETSEEVATE